MAMAIAHPSVFAAIQLRANVLAVEDICDLTRRGQTLYFSRTFTTTPAWSEAQGAAVPVRSTETTLGSPQNES